MKIPIIVEDTGSAAPDVNMAKDRQLLEQLSHIQKMILHFYDWDRPSATFGFFSTPHQFIKEPAISSKKITLAKRPTGGGILFHLWDFTFSLLIPSTHANFSINTLDNYKYVNRIVINAIKRAVNDPHIDLTLLQNEILAPNAQCGCFCMAKPSPADVMWKGCKVAGGAQRRTKQGFLHQGSISLCPPDMNFLDELVDAEILEEIHKYSGSLLPDRVTSKEKEDFKQRLKDCLIEEASSFFI